MDSSHLGQGRHTNAHAGMTGDQNRIRDVRTIKSARKGYPSGANLLLSRGTSRGLEMSNSFCVLNQRVLLHPKSTTAGVAFQVG
jgi:hypothetical protein